MTQKIKNLIIAIMLTIVPLSAPVALSSVASADCSASDINQGISAGASAGFKGTSCSNDLSTGVDQQNGLAAFAKTAVNIMSLIVGVLAVLMIVYGGLRYVTSGGSSEGVGNAKNVIIYALIGLIIVALAQAIVHFVLNAALNNTSSLT